YAYISFLVWNSITTYWIYFSTPAGMAFAVLANSLLMSLVFVGYHIVAKRSSFFLSTVFLGSLWISFEYLHLHWDFSWPWLNLGNGFSEYPQWVQWYEYTGSFGGTLWIWLVNIVFFKALLRYIHHKEKQKIYRPLGIALLLIGIPILCSYLIGLGYTAEKDQNQIEVLILQ